MTKKRERSQSQWLRVRALLAAGRLADAEPLLAKLCQGDRRDANAWLTLGAVRGQRGNHAGAAEALGRAVRLRPRHAPAHFNLGVALRASGRWEEAAATFAEAVRLDPTHQDARRAHGQALMAVGRYQAAVASYREQLRTAPEDPEAHANLGLALHRLGRLAEAVAAYRRSLELYPGERNTQDNLAAALTQQGMAVDAVAVYREALSRRPDDARAHSNLLLSLQYLDEIDPAELFAEHRRWGERHGRPNGSAAPFINPVDPERRLRVGYVSADLREHSVAYFLEPLLEHGDHERFDHVCYSAVPRPDAVTARLQAHADLWRDIVGRDDADLARQIREDRIDVLVDLAGHTAGNRLPLFARRTAPVQATYLGYPGTTGVPAIDYRLCDATTDPPGDEAYHTEELVRLPGCFLCYRPPADAPRVEPAPSATAGRVTFGSFNNLAKVNTGVVDAWAEVLRVLPDARLLLKSAFFSDAATADRYRALFAERGVAGERIETVGRAPTTVEHLAVYRRLDVALDTFPYNGTTTTCEALWMGVPVVTLAGHRHASRVGASLLGAVGLAELVAGDRREYVARAVAMARDRARLASLRRELRGSVAASPLCEPSAFARRVEDRYRWMWRRWCASGT
jgi:predicted O-linked N-acetylglucosamine transferase (SPINDLY family)